MKQITKWGTKKELQFAMDQIEFGHPGDAVWKEKKNIAGNTVYAVMRTDMMPEDEVQPPRTRNIGRMMIR